MNVNKVHTSKFPADVGDILYLFAVQVIGLLAPLPPDDRSPSNETIKKNLEELVVATEKEIHHVIAEQAR